MKGSRKTKILRVSGTVLLGLVLSGLILNHTLTGARYTQEDTQMIKIKSSAQFKNGKFHNRKAPSSSG